MVILNGLWTYVSLLHIRGHLYIQKNKTFSMNRKENKKRYTESSETEKRNKKRNQTTKIRMQYKKKIKYGHIVKISIEKNIGRGNS